MSSYYTLYIGIDNDAPNRNELEVKYSNYLNIYNKQSKMALENGENTFDAGFDLFSPIELRGNNDFIKLNHNIRCSMTFTNNNNNNESYCGYYLYSRSSTATKTPLRLANCVGIIDSGYRGNIIACFDNLNLKDYNIEEHQRLVQICPPNLSYPMIVKLVNVDELNNTERGTGGFGSTGI